MATPASHVPSSAPHAVPTNPHVLWRQILGFVLWVGLLSFAATGPIGAVLSLLLGGVTFAGAWKSGISSIPIERAS